MPSQKRPLVESRPAAAPVQTRVAPTTTAEKVAAQTASKRIEREVEKRAEVQRVEKPARQPVVAIAARAVAPVVRQVVVQPVVRQPAPQTTAEKVAEKTVVARATAARAPVAPVVRRPVTAARPQTTAEKVAAQTVRPDAKRPDTRPPMPNIVNPVMVVPGRGAPVVPPQKNELPHIFDKRRPPPRGAQGGRDIPGRGFPTGPDIPLVIPDHWPIHLTAQTLLLPGASGQSPALQTLRAPSGRWLVIEEVKFEVMMSVLDNADVLTVTTNAHCMGSTVACGLQRGKDDITNGYVPVPMFGPVQKQSAERIYFPEDVSNNWSFCEEYSWRPPVPIVVAPNQVLTPTFQHRGYLDYKARVRISYSGHLEHLQPEGYGNIPYVASWTAPIISLTGTEAEQLSTEKDLVNPSKHDVLNVEYMMGRIYVPFQNTTTASILEGTVYHPGHASTVNVPLATDQTVVKIGTSWANPVTPEYDRFPAVFDLVNRKIDMKHIVPPEGYFVMGVKSGGTLIANAQVLALFSIVGHREVAP
jgi:hypothetical protein